MGMLSDFRDFAIKGNALDLAVGVIIGAAFGKIVDSIVKDLIMPVVGAIFGGFDFSNYFIPLKEVPAGVNAQSLVEVQKANIPVLAYGNFITILINFLILAFIIFMMINSINKAKARLIKAPQAKSPVTPEDIVLLREIRDSLRRQ